MAGFFLSACERQSVVTCLVGSAVRILRRVSSERHCWEFFETVQGTLVFSYKKSTLDGILNRQII